MAQAELHFLRSRLLGGKLNKAQKGELRAPLPVGFCHDDEGRIVIDADAEVRGAVAAVFRLFEATGSAYGVVQRFVAQGLRFPKRAYGGAWDGKLVWGRLSHGRVLGVLKNPVYAGTYVYGRYQYRRQISTQGEVRKHVQVTPMREWRVNLPTHHEGYISWDEFLKNQERMAKNRTNTHAALLNGPPREGMALLQGLLLCGCCGHALTVRYLGNGGIYPLYLCSWQRRDGSMTRDCMSVRCDLLDAAVARAALEALEPEQLALAVAAVEELRTRDQALLQQWRMRLERAQYEAALAERRYEENDPSNRLVAATLEQRWDEKLTALEELKKQYREVEGKQARVATPEQKKQVLALATDLPRLWHAPSTQARDRKRILRLLIKDITVEKHRPERQAVLHIRWHGGACTDLTVDLPLPRAEQIRYPQSLVARVRELARDLPDTKIADQLNHERCVSATGKPFSKTIVSWIRWRHQIPAAQLKRPEELTVRQVAEKFGVSTHMVYYWLGRGTLTARQLRPNMPYWITLTAEKSRDLRARIKCSYKLPRSTHS
jgi:hypothetical protein